MPENTIQPQNPTEPKDLEGVGLDRLVRLLHWAEKEQGKAWNQWIKEPPNKDAPKSRFLITRSETMRDVVKKIKREMRGLPLPNVKAHTSLTEGELHSEQDSAPPQPPETKAGQGLCDATCSASS